MIPRRAWKKTAYAARLLAILALTSTPARAEVYDVPILVESVEDLRDMLENGDIDDTIFDRLSALLEDPLDLNTASRNALYDLPGLTFPMIDDILEARSAQPLASVDDLMGIGIPEPVLRQVRPFVTVAPPKAKAARKVKPIRGDIDVRFIDRVADREAKTTDTVTVIVDPVDTTTETDVTLPAVALRARTVVVDKVQVGVIALGQERIGSFDYHHEPGRTWLSADGPAFRLQVPKYYVAMDEGGWAAILGTFQAGFAESLVFDSSTRSRPDGIYIDDQVSEYTDSTRFGQNERTLGAAFTFRGLHLGGTNYLDGTIFFSYFPRDISQNDVDSILRETDDSDFAPSGAPNPLLCENGVDPELCASQDPDTRQGRLSSETLRAAFHEAIIGGHLAWSPRPRLQIGMTSYASFVHWPESDDLVFAPSAAYPAKKDFGAYGVDFRWGTGRTDISAEYARTFDGDDAAFLRLTTSLGIADLEVRGRYYSEGYDNPHARGTAQPDELLGQRDRDEAGGEVRLVLYPTYWMEARVSLDVWHRMSLGVENLSLNSRLAFELTRRLGMTLGVQYQDKVLGKGGRDTEYDDDIRSILGIDNRTVGPGIRVSVWWTLSADLGRRTKLRLEYKSSFQDIETTDAESGYYQEFTPALYNWYHAHMEHTLTVAGALTVKPVDPLTLQMRVKYREEDTKFDFRGEAYVEGWLQARYTFKPGWYLQGRYRVRVFTDARDSLGADRGPAVNPDQLVKVAAGLRF
ncbi:MAG: hypothetical protein H6746_06590 [Deltaproteobacteria bacterium]|nr:hypothetical protein [Deltaproteobacteria bacterium]